MTPWTGAHQAPLSTGFPREEYWNGLSFPTGGDLPDRTQVSSIAGRFLTEPPEMPLHGIYRKLLVTV